MSSRSNQLLAGIVILLFGLFIFFQRHINISLGWIMLIICGIAFVASYKTKHRSWTLILGGYLIYIGAANIVGGYVPYVSVLKIFNAMFFIVPGVILYILYRDKGTRALLAPSVILIAIGVSQISKILGLGGLLAWLPQAFAALLIIVSIGIILKALKNRDSQ